MSVQITFDGLCGVDGSARFSFGQMTAVASVSGPIASARLAAEHPVRATVDVLLRPLSSVPGTAEKRDAIALKGIFERACILAHHPRTLIQVVVQALSSSLRSAGGLPHGNERTNVLLAAEINACSLALLSAGSIPMRGVVCAVAVVQSDPASQPQVVAVGGDQHAYAGCFVFLFGVDHVSSPQITDMCQPPSKMIWTNYRATPGSSFSATALAEAEKVALDGATAIWKRMKENMRTSSFAGDGQP